MGMDRRKSPVQSKRMTFSSGKVVVICAIVTTLCSVGLSMTMLSGGISHVSVQKNNVSWTTIAPRDVITGTMARGKRTTKKLFRHNGDLVDRPLYEGDMSIRKKRQMPMLLEKRLICPLEPPCDSGTFEAFVPHEEMILGIKNSRVHMLSPDGHVLIPNPMHLESVFPDAAPNITAALRIKDQYYLFFGSTYMKYRPIRRPPVYPRPIAVPTGFHGVPVPVDAAFQLNPHTYVFVSGTNFVFYQPDANPPVNPAYSPNVLANIFGGPALIQTAFNTPDGRRFLLANNVLYEINDKMQITKVQPFRKGTNGLGWLDCPTETHSGCTSEGLPVLPQQIQIPVTQHVETSTTTTVSSSSSSTESPERRTTHTSSLNTSPVTSQSMSTTGSIATVPATSSSTITTTILTTSTDGVTDVPLRTPRTASGIVSLPSFFTVPHSSTQHPSEPTTHVITIPTMPTEDSETMVDSTDPSAEPGRSQNVPAAANSMAARLDRQEFVLQELMERLNNLTRIMAILPMQLQHVQGSASPRRSDGTIHRLL